MHAPRHSHAFWSELKFSSGRVQQLRLQLMLADDTRQHATAIESKATRHSVVASHHATHGIATRRSHVTLTAAGPRPPLQLMLTDDTRQPATAIESKATRHSVVASHHTTHGIATRRSHVTLTAADPARHSKNVATRTTC